MGSNHGHGQELRANNPSLIEALKKTDKSAHIILKSCSTGKLRTDQGISMADQLSLSLPGRTVTANSMDSNSRLIEDSRFPHGITLYSIVRKGWNSMDVVPTNSFCIKGNERLVRILAPFHVTDSLAISAESRNLFLEKHKPQIEEDNKHKSNELSNKYRYYHTYFSFKPKGSAIE